MRASKPQHGTGRRFPGTYFCPSRESNTKLHKPDQLLPPTHRCAVLHQPTESDKSEPAAQQTHLCVSVTYLVCPHVCSRHPLPPTELVMLQAFEKKNTAKHDANLNQSCNRRRSLEHFHAPPRLSKKKRIRAQARCKVPQQWQWGCYLVVFIAAFIACRGRRRSRRLRGGRGLTMLVGSSGCGGRGGDGATLGESCSLHHLLRLPLLVLRSVPGLTPREVHLQQNTRARKSLASADYTHKVGYSGTGTCRCLGRNLSSSKTRVVT